MLEYSRSYGCKEDFVNVAGNKILTWLVWGWKMRQVAAGRLAKARLNWAWRGVAQLFQASEGLTRSKIRINVFPVTSVRRARHLQHLYAVFRGEAVNNALPRSAIFEAERGNVTRRGGVEVSTSRDVFSINVQERVSNCAVPQGLQKWKRRE